MMDDTRTKWEIVTGRSLLGLYFLVPGIMKFLAPDMHVALMEHHGLAFAPPLMWFAAVVNVAGGLALISGRHVRLVAFGFVIYILLVNAISGISPASTAATKCRTSSRISASSRGFWSWRVPADHVQYP